MFPQRETYNKTRKSRRIGSKDRIRRTESKPNFFEEGMCVCKVWAKDAKRL